MGVPREKLIVSIPTFGLSFTLEDQQKHRIGDPIVGLGQPGRQTRTSGMLAAYEICEAIQEKTYERRLSNESIVVLALEEKSVVLFDDTQGLMIGQNVLVNGTVELKGNLLRDWQLAGVLVHSIDLDEYTGSACRRGKYPILSIIARLFNASTTTPAPSPPSLPIKQRNPCLNVSKDDLIADFTTSAHPIIPMLWHICNVPTRCISRPKIRRVFPRLIRRRRDPNQRRPSLQERSSVQPRMDCSPIHWIAPDSTPARIHCPFP